MLTSFLSSREGLRCVSLDACVDINIRIKLLTKTKFLIRIEAKIKEKDRDVFVIKRKIRA